MKPAHYGILFFLSVLLASITYVSPWAEAVFQIGKFTSILDNQVKATNEKMILSVSPWDKLLRVDGCPRGSVKGLDYGLDIWIWIGRITLLGQICLWLSFLSGAILRTEFRLVAIWSAVLIFLFLIFLFISESPIRECIYTQLPPPLIFKQWYISVVSVLLSYVSLLCGIWINVSIHKIPLNGKAG